MAFRRRPPVRKKPRGNARGMFRKKPRCPFAIAGVSEIDYKDVDLLSRYLRDDWKIAPAEANNVSARMQRQLTRAVKRARFLAFLPYTRRHHWGDE